MRCSSALQFLSSTERRSERSMIGSLTLPTRPAPSPLGSQACIATARVASSNTAHGVRAGVARRKIVTNPPDSALISSGDASRGSPSLWSTAVGVSVVRLLAGGDSSASDSIEGCEWSAWFADPHVDRRCEVLHEPCWAEAIVGGDVQDRRLVAAVETSSRDHRRSKRRDRMPDVDRRGLRLSERN